MPIILNAFAVDILRKLRWEHIDFTAMNASPPAISPAAPLFIYACVLRDMVFISFLKVRAVILCKIPANIRKPPAEITEKRTANTRKIVPEYKKTAIEGRNICVFVLIAYRSLCFGRNYTAKCQNEFFLKKTCKNPLTKKEYWCII